MKNRLPVSSILFFLSLPRSSSFLIPTKKQAAYAAITISSLTKGNADKEPENQYATASEKFNARWNVMFERLKEYKEEYGDCLVPQKYADDPKLGQWVAHQRKVSTIDEKTKQERRDKLNSIGFVWSVREAGRSSKLDKKWNDKFERLVQYKQEHGDCLVPKNYKEYKEDTLLPSLGTWVSHQRKLHANNKLRPDRMTKLESIGFVWVAGESLSAREKQWEEMFERLEEYSREYGNCLVPDRYKEDPSLGVWVSKQRFRCDELDSERISRLELIGFVWDPLDKNWEDMFLKLEEYRQLHGDCLVPRGYQKDPSLGTWVRTQRLHRDELDSDRIARLESVGFVWDAFDKQWEEMFAKLEEYSQKNGDCLVPQRYQKDPSLGFWVKTQRMRREVLDPARRERLDSIEFVWDPLDKKWEDMFAKLKEYRRLHGDCLVPKDYKEDHSLGKWVNTQRRKRGELDSERILRLESIGFVWGARDHTWESMFANLEEYYRKNRDCLVPRGYKEDPSLGDWVSRQRSRRDHLDSERIARLESIGFVWRIREQRALS